MGTKRVLTAGECNVVILSLVAHIAIVQRQLQKESDVQVRAIRAAQIEELRALKNVFQSSSVEV